MSDSLMECSNCGKKVNTKLDETVCYDEIIYTRRCVNCGHMIESFTVKREDGVS